MNPTDEFERLRTQLHIAAEKKGFTHPDVIVLSQELDYIHNQLWQPTQRVKKSQT